jgi:alkylation response protein AidB-like acyl-CoA dehydrogenase
MSSPGVVSACRACVKNGRNALDFALNEQQEMMQKLARGFLAAEYPEKVLRAVVSDEKGFLPELWQKMAAIHLTGLSLPEEQGGVGDFLDLAVVLEEMGKACFICPFFATVVLGAGAIMAAGSDEQKKRYLPSIVEGRSLMTLAVAGPAGKYAADAVDIKAARSGTDFILHGTGLFVPDALVADFIICAARTDDGITLFIVDINSHGVTVKPLPTISGDKLCEVRLENVRVSKKDVLGKVAEGWGYIEKVLERASVALCAGMVGLAGQALKMTLDYAKERTAFGHPIGAFQSLQHRCADMLVDVDGSRLVTYQAAWRINEGLPAARETAIAKAWVSQACRRVMASAHQVHGAIGFSEDHVLHLYTKKSLADEFSFGNTSYHLDKIV